MNPSRILFFVSSLKSGGAEHHVLNLTRFLKSKGIVTAICTISPGENELDSQVMLDGIELYRVPLHSLMELVFPSKLKAISNVVSSFKPNLIHAHLYHAEVVASAASYIAKVPLVITRHSAGLEFNGIRRIIARVLQRRCSAVIAVSEEISAEAAALGYPPEKTIVLPNAIDVSRFRPMSGNERSSRRREFLLNHFGIEPSERTVIIGAVGGLKEVKNYPLFVDMASSLLKVASGSEKDPDLRFVIIGEGKMREELERLVSERSLDSHLALPGYTDRMEEIIPLIDILVITSRTEGVPLSLLEAMSCGVVPVSAGIGDVGKVMGECGILVRDYSLESYVKAVCYLVENPSARAELSKRAAERIRDKYDRESWGKKILELYEKVLP